MDSNGNLSKARQLIQGIYGRKSRRRDIGYSFPDPGS
jgi:hypothetical protein